MAAQQSDAAAALQRRCADLEQRCQQQEQQQGGRVQRVQQLEAEQSAAQAKEQGQQTIIARLQEQVGLLHSVACASACWLSARLLARQWHLNRLLGQEDRTALLSCML